MSNTVKWSGYLAIKCPNAQAKPSYPGMWKTTAKLSVKRPGVSKDEIAVKVSVELPATLYQRPSLEARISVPADAVTPPLVDLEVIDNIEEMIAQSTGFEVKLVQVEGGGG